MLFHGPIWLSMITNNFEEDFIPFLFIGFLPFRMLLRKSSSNLKGRKSSLGALPPSISCL